MAREFVASLALAVGVYWILGWLLRGLVAWAGAESQVGELLSTLLLFLSPGYLGPSVIIALASSAFVLISHFRPDSGEEPPESGAYRQRQHWAFPRSRKPSNLGKTLN